MTNKPSNWEFDLFFVECYEEMIIDRVNEKLKTFSQGIDDALDRMEEEAIQKLIDEMEEDEGFDG